MNKAEKLNKLKQRMEEDKSLPLREGATQLVFGEGSPDADIYFFGEAPGFWEDQKARPFVGQSGRLLDEAMQGIGLKREGVYISNIVRFRPPENRDPTDEEIAAFAPYIDEEIEIIDPKIIVTLGRFSMGKFIPGVKISQIHGKPRTIKWKGKDLILLPMYHPAAALRAGAVMKEFKEDFKRIPELLKKAPEPEKDPEPENPKTQQLGLDID